MDEVTLKAKLWGTIHDLCESRKAVGTLVTVLSAALATVLGVVFSHLGPKLGLDAELSKEIPALALGLAGLIVAKGASYVNAQAKVDAATASAQGATSLSSPEAKAAVQALATEALKALLAQPLRTETSPVTRTVFEVSSVAPPGPAGAPESPGTPPTAPAPPAQS